MDDILLEVEGVSKKFSRTLKHFVYYSLADLARQFICIPPDTQHLRKGEQWSVRNVSLSLRRGECLGIIGPNGSGKSTLLKLLCGILSPDQGRIVLRGSVGSLIEVGAGFHPMLTGRENIHISASILGYTKNEISRKLDAIIEFSELGEYIDSPVKYYSSGMNVRLGFAIASQMEPDILLIDEVLAVGDMGFRSKCMNAMDRMKRNSAVVFVSHNMPQVARVCDRVMVLNQAQTVLMSTDVMQGLETYLELFPAEKSQVSGDGRAALEYFKFISLEGRPVSDQSIKMTYLDDLEIEMAIKLSSGIDFAIINIAFFNMDSTLVAECHSNRKAFQVQNKKSTNIIRVRLPQLQLNPGRYHVMVVVADKERGTTYARYSNLAQIHVTGTYMGFAPVQINGEWNQTPP